jgi:hypothetical protein
VLLIPGGEIANLKYVDVDTSAGNSSSNSKRLFITAYPSSERRDQSGGSDSVIRETR